MTDAGAGDAGAGAGAGTGAAAGSAGAAAGGGGTPWHNGIDAAVIGFAQNKGWLADDPKVTFGKVVEAYRGAESKLGVAPERLLRMPEPTAKPEDLDAFWTRLGAVKEAKDIDFSGVKNSAGDPIDKALADSIAAAAISSRIPKDGAVAITAAVQKYMDGVVAEQTATATARRNEQAGKLEKSWGRPDSPNFQANLADVRRFFTKWASAANVDEKTATEAIDAISKLGGVGAASFMEMALVLAKRMGEDRFVSTGTTGDNVLLSAEAAKAQLAELKKDTAWLERWSKGGVVEREQVKKLNQIIAGTSSYAA